MAGEQIKRSISLSVTDGHVVLEEFDRIGAGAEKNLKDRVGASAEAASGKLKETGESAGAFGGAMRQHLTQAGDDVNRLFNQINSGRDVMQALSIEGPKILDVFANPFLTAAGTVIGAFAAIGAQYVSFSAYQTRLEQQTQLDVKALDDLSKSLHLNLDGIDAAAASFGSLSEAQQGVAKASLKQIVDDETAAMENSEKVADRYIAKLTAFANFDPRNTQFSPTDRSEAGNIGTGGLGDLGGFPAPTAQPAPPAAAGRLGINDIPAVGLTGVDTAQVDDEAQHMADLAQKVRDLYGEYKSGQPVFAEFIQSLHDLAEASALTEAGARKEVGAVIEETDAHEVGARALALYKAQYDLFLSLMGDHSKFDAIDQAALNQAKSVGIATAALEKYDIAAKQSAMDQAVLELDKMGRFAEATALQQEGQRQIDAITKGMQETADRNEIHVKLGVDVTQADALFNELKSAQERLGGNQTEQVARIREAARTINEQNGEMKISAEAVNAVIERMAQGYRRTATEAERQAQEQELIAKGFSIEDADRFIASLHNVNEGLNERDKITAQIAEKERGLAALTSPSDDQARKNVQAEINQLIAQRNALLQTQQDKLTAIDKSNKDVLDSLDAALAKSASRDVTQATIDTAGRVARDRIRIATPEERAVPGGEQEYQRNLVDAAAAETKGREVEYDKLFTDADAEIQKQDEKIDAIRQKAIGITDSLISPQERYNDEVAKLSPLLDGNVEDQLRYNAAIDELNRRLPILQKEYELRLQRQKIEQLEQSQNPVDWASAGLKSIQLEANDTGHVVAGAFTSGFDSINHGFFEVVSNQQQGWADMKQAALSFVDTLGEVAMKQFEIMLINRTIGLVSSAFGPSYSAPAAGNYSGVMQSGDIMASYGHAGIRAGETGRTAYLPAALFAAAERYHAGGRIEPHERAIVVEVGEEVLTRQDSREWQSYKREAAARFHGGGVVAPDVPAHVEHAPRFHGGGIVGMDGRLPSPSAPLPPGGDNTNVTIRQEVHNTFNGVYDMDTLRTVTDLSAAKAHAELARAFRSDPNLRRQVGRGG